MPTVMETLRDDFVKEFVLPLENKWTELEKKKWEEMKLSGGNEGSLAPLPLVFVDNMSPLESFLELQ